MDMIETVMEIGIIWLLSQQLLKQKRVLMVLHIMILELRSIQGTIMHMSAKQLIIGRR